MFERIKYRYRLWKLLRSKKRTQKTYDRAIKEVKSKEDEQQIISEAIHFIGEEDLWIRELHTNYLCYVARRLIVPIPEFKDQSTWEQVRSLDRYILTPSGIYELKKLIRIEQKERREIVFSWITLLIGLLGVLIGVISVLKE